MVLYRRRDADVLPTRVRRNCCWLLNVDAVCTRDYVRWVCRLRADVRSRIRHLLRLRLVLGPDDYHDDDDDDDESGDDDAAAVG